MAAGLGSDLALPFIDRTAWLIGVQLLMAAGAPAPPDPTPPKPTGPVRDHGHGSSHTGVPLSGVCSEMIIAQPVDRDGPGRGGGLHAALPDRSYRRDRLCPRPLSPYAIPRMMLFRASVFAIYVLSPGTQSQHTSSYITTGWYVDFESQVTPETH